MLTFSRRLAAAIIIAACATSLSAAPTRAYVLNGWVFDTGIGNLKYYQGAGDSYTLSAYDWARTVWNNSPTEFWMPTKVSTASQAQFRLWEEWSNGSGHDGETWATFDADGYLNHVDIYLNTYYTDGYSAAKRDSVSAHEFGHGANLGDRYGSTLHILMNGQTPYRCGSPCINTPQGDDNNGVNATY